MKLRIGILGTRGIPNHYGGFEQATAWLSSGLAAHGHEVTVYNSHNHPYQQKSWNGVQLIHCYDPEYYLKTAGQFIYDLNCIIDARKRDFDIILFMGYTSSSIWHFLFPGTVIVSNMDGLEWKRSKYNRLTRLFLKYAEALAVRHSHFHIADSKSIRQYLHQSYSIWSHYIAYAASRNIKTRPGLLEEFDLKEKKFHMLMARMEPENNIEMILEGFHRSHSIDTFLVVGNVSNRYGRYIVKKFSADPRIRFTGSLFDQEEVHTLRANCSSYFHGHSVGGTNPSLLEAMSSGAFIIAHKNRFNREVLGQDALFFSNAEEVTRVLRYPPEQTIIEKAVNNNFLKLELYYNQETIVQEYERFLVACVDQMTHEKTVPHKRYAHQ